MGQLHNGAGLFNVLINAILAAVEHDGAEAAVDGCQRFFIGAMVHMQANRHGGLQEGHEILYHIGNGAIAAHVLGGAAGHAQNDGGLLFFSRQQEGTDRFHVVQVKVTDSIVVLLGIREHFFCVYVRHKSNLLYFPIGSSPK